MTRADNRWSDTPTLQRVGHQDTKVCDCANTEDI